MESGTRNPYKSQGKSNWIREDYITDYYTFLKSIDWTEWWLVSILIFHSSCFIIILLSRRCHSLQFILFFKLLSIVYFAENINELGAKHWKLFSNEQYFDSSGLFISTVLSIPILVNCTILIVLWLYSAGTMLVKTKRAQVAHSAHRTLKSSKDPEETKKTK